MSRLTRRKLSTHVTNQLLEGRSVETVMRQLAAYLVSERRLHEQELIVRDIEQALAEHGVVAARVTSARSLTGEAHQALESLIKREYDTDSDVMLLETIDKSVIGGAKLELPGKLLDRTVKTKLEHLTI